MMKKRKRILTGTFAACVTCVILVASHSHTLQLSNKLASSVSTHYGANKVDAPIERYSKLTEMTGAHYSIEAARASVGQYTTRLGFAAEVHAGAITSGRVRSLVAAAVGLISVVIGGLALARAGRIGTGSRRGQAIVAFVLGLIGTVLSVLHLGTSTGGFGTGSGRAGAIVALAVGLIGMSLGGLTLARSRRIARAGNVVD